MLTTLLLTLALPGTQAPAADTTQTFAGVLNQQYAWGTVALQDGRVLRGFLPTGANGVPDVVACYAPRPDGRRPRRPQMLLVANVRWMRVGHQYSELLSSGAAAEGQLAARRATGALELFVVKARPAMLVNFMGPTPVAGLPTTSAPAYQGAVSWYLRRPGQAAVYVEPASFARQVPPLLRQAPELARRVATGSEGYRLTDLESIVQQYNQRVK